MAGFAPVFGAHPLITEDTATQGQGNAELEHGFTLGRDRDGRSTAFQPQFSFGRSTTLDLIAQPSWLDQRPVDGPRTRGVGDTALDAKWRFYGDAPLSFAVRAGVNWPTGRRRLGLAHGAPSEHALLAMTVDAVPFTWHMNLAVTRNPRSSGLRRATDRASGAMMYAPNESLTLTSELAVERDANPSSKAWNRSVLAGAIWTLRPGFDLDAGLQHGIAGHAGAWSLLVGATYRWAP